MKRKNFALILGFGSAAALVMFGTMLLFAPTKLPYFTDSELVSKTKEFREVQVFLAKYPNATASVQRTASDIFVDHYASYPEANSKVGNVTAKKPYLYIFIVLDERTLRPHQISLICSDGSEIFFHGNPDGYRYNATQINDDEVLPYLENGKERICIGR